MSDETVNEPVAPVVETPMEVIPSVEEIPQPAPAPEPATDQMGANEPFASTPVSETPAVTPNLAPIEATVPEVVQPFPVESATEATSAQAPIETPTSTETTPAPAPATMVPPIVVPVPAQTLTRSMRELFTKAQSAIQFRKRKKLDRIMNLFAKQTKITNDEVEKLLHVSDATATRYLSTLEKEGKIQQKGKVGHTVSYVKM